MPRDGSGNYSVPPGTDGISGTTIVSTKYNSYIHDVEFDLNQPRPIIAGGTGATNATTALYNVSGEKATQVVTNWDSQVWVPGSFYAASSATGAAPVAGHAFAGQCYIGETLANPPTNQNVVLEARDLDYTTPPGPLYVRQKRAGTWSGWTSGGGNAAPFDALAFNGMQINGSMDVSQQYGSSTVSLPNGNTSYVIDGFSMQPFHATAVFAGFQAAAAVVPFSNSLSFFATTGGNVGATATDICRIIAPIEGFRVARLQWGTTNAQPITIALWIWATVAGTLTISVGNGANNRSYLVDVSVIAGAWQYKTITIPGDTAGTWIKDASGIGLKVNISSRCGSNFQGTAGAWQAAGNLFSTSATTNFFATNNNQIIITGFGVWPGLEAPSDVRSPFIMRPYDQELVTCQRYYRPLLVGNGAYGVPGRHQSATGWVAAYGISPPMRAAPTLLISSVSHFNAGAGITSFPFTSLSLFYAVPNSVLFSGTVASGLTSGQASEIVSISALGNLAFDARL